MPSSIRGERVVWGVLCTQHPRGPLGRQGQQGRGHRGRKEGLPLEESASNHPRTACPERWFRLPKTCLWAPGYLEAALYSYTTTAAGQCLPAPAPGTMPTCPHPKCPCAHRNITAEALLNHVQSSSWASLYFCAKCKCVCKSESVLLHVSPLLCVSKYLPC
jgi:hypothetical protein